MSKLFSGIIIATMLLGFTSSNQTQVLADVPKPIQPVLTTPVAPTLDFKLMGKAVAKFWQTNRAQTESQMVIDINYQGMRTPVTISVKTIAHVGNKFRTELTFGSSNKVAEKTYTMISNGETVWIYNRDNRQYSQMSLSKFQSGNDSFFIGLSSVIFLSMPSEKTREEIVTGLASDENLFAKAFKDQLQDITGSTRQLDGKNVYAYSLALPKDDLNLEMIVEPQTAMLKQIRLDIKKDGMDLKLVENILNRNTSPTINQATFRFIRPKGVKKVKSMSIGPF